MVPGLGGGLRSAGVQGLRFMGLVGWVCRIGFFVPSVCSFLVLATVHVCHYKSHAVLPKQNCYVAAFGSQAASCTPCRAAKTTPVEGTWWN